MPELGTQTEVRDTHRNVYTQCGEANKITVATIVEYREMKTIDTRPRFLTKQKKKAPRKPNMKVSEANTEVIKKRTHGKCVGTSDYVPKAEEPEVIFLKEINHIELVKSTRNKEEENKMAKRRPRPEAKLSRQEKLYRDILEGEKNPARKRQRIDIQGKENVNEAQVKQKRIIERKKRSEHKNNAWLEKFREWSPTQDWPITKNWQRRDNITRSNRETYLRIKF